MMLWNAAFGLGFVMDDRTFALAGNRDLDRSSRSFVRLTLHASKAGTVLGIVCQRKQKMLGRCMAVMVIPRDVERATDR